MRLEATGPEPAEREGALLRDVGWGMLGALKLASLMVWISASLKNPFCANPYEVEISVSCSVESPSGQRVESDNLWAVLLIRSLWITQSGSLNFPD